MTDHPEGTTDSEPFEPSYLDYSAEDLLEQAQSNAQAALIATVAFLLDRQIPLDEWVAFLGERFAIAWEDEEPWGADEFLDAMLANYRSLGAEVLTVSFDPERSEAVIRGFPDPDACARFGASVEAVAHFHDATGPIAARRGLRWSWILENPTIPRTRLNVAIDEA
jgi:hypothetical protein